MNKLVAFGLIGMAAFLLCGCSMFSGSNAPKDAAAADAAAPEPAAEVPVGEGCPTSAVLAEASTITRLRPGGGKDPTDVMLSANMMKPKVSCEYDKGTRKLKVSARFSFTATRGPAAANAPQTLPYFVAVIDLDNTVISKQTFSQEVSFGGQPAVGFDENTGDIVIEVGKGKKLVGYEVLVGFQLTRDELAYNRAQHRYMP